LMNRRMNWDRSDAKFERHEGPVAGAKRGAQGVVSAI
jgi:hypothetical protein